MQKSVQIDLRYLTVSARVRSWSVTVACYNPHPTARIPTNPGIAPRIASKNNRSLAG